MKERALRLTQFGIAVAGITFVSVGIFRVSGFEPARRFALFGCLLLASAAVVSAVAYLSAQTEDKAVIVASLNVNLLVFLTGGLLVVAAQTAQWGNALFWSMACLAIGGVTGLLFGAPADSSKKSALDEIRDWLTKIIVGVGLTQLSKIPEKLNLWATYVAESLNASKGHPSTDAVRGSLALILYFVSLGFVGGYLLTKAPLGELLRSGVQDANGQEKNAPLERDEGKPK